MRTVAFMIRRTSGTLAAGSDSIQNTILKAHPHKIMQITSIILQLINKTSLFSRHVKTGDNTNAP